MSSQEGAVASSAAGERIRPSRTEGEEDPEKFLVLFDEFRNPETLSRKTIAAICGVSEGTVSNWLAAREFPEKARRSILKYMFEDQNLLSGATRRDLAEIPDALYFAFLNWIDVKETSQDNARARIVGTYKLWRYSVEHEGEYVYGRIRFQEDPVTRALKVDMLQPKTTHLGVHGSIETGHGYLFRVSHMYLMMIQDEHTRDVRVTIFPRSKVDMIGTDVDPQTGAEREGANPRCQFRGKNLHIVHLDGFALGIDGSSGFFSPVHLSLVDNLDEIAALDSQLDVLPPSDRERVPPRVVEKLARSGPIRRL